MQGRGLEEARVTSTGFLLETPVWWKNLRHREPSPHSATRPGCSLPHAKIPQRWSDDLGRGGDRHLPYSGSLPKYFNPSQQELLLVLLPDLIGAFVVSINGSGQVQSLSSVADRWRMLRTLLVLQWSQQKLGVKLKAEDGLGLWSFVGLGKFCIKSSSMP